MCLIVVIGFNVFAALEAKQSIYIIILFQANSASYPKHDGKLVAYAGNPLMPTGLTLSVGNLGGGMSVAALQVQLFASVGNGWPHTGSCQSAATSQSVKHFWS